MLIPIDFSFDFKGFFIVFEGLLRKGKKKNGKLIEKEEKDGKKKGKERN
jgi:hypothetical protein